jgi:hypothetical protein
MTTQALANPYGWLRSAPFDLGFIVGVAALALASGALVTAQPALFPVVLFLDLWLLGYHHVVATFTRLAFDRESFRAHRFLVLGLPLVVLAAVVGAAWAAGGWILSTTYLYWQWFHYTRQSYGIERVYRRKLGGDVPGDERLTRWALYLVAGWGILHRSYQAPETFLGVELKTLPVPAWLDAAAGAVALVVLGWWLVRAAAGVRAQRRLGAHTLYLATHMVIFIVAYVAIDSIDSGWLVVNVWHNAQYILFVWVFNSNRFQQGTDAQHRLLSSISQRRHWPYYFLTCLVISTVAYFGIDRTLALAGASATLPLFLVTYQTINFHHYVVDSLIWKVRKKPLQKTLGLAG